MDVKNLIQRVQQCKCISGGGSYDEEDGEIKIGKWIELKEGFSKDSQILYQGEYQNGKKLGRWEIMYRHNTSNPFSQMQKILQKVHNQNFNVLVVVDPMNQKKMQLRLGSGLIWMRSLIIGIKQFIQGNIIMVSKLVHGQK
ncbi:unnamed protein product [Paramecium primaurelia]|uniref:Uncharacterized protein n=1 Tax=Paramecium primaurelia TaxID=5886 RepID=A0A8S1QPD3_PARPR|nr:unnamed protein product [Paramecium primaurelia]